MFFRKEVSIEKFEYSDLKKNTYKAWIFSKIVETPTE